VQRHHAVAARDVAPLGGHAQRGGEDLVGGVCFFVVFVVVFCFCGLGAGGRSGVSKSGGAGCVCVCVCVGGGGARDKGRAPRKNRRKRTKSGRKRERRKSNKKKSNNAPESVARADPSASSGSKPRVARHWRAGASLLHAHVSASVVKTGTATVSTGTMGRYLATRRAVLPPRVSTTISEAWTFFWFGFWFGLGLVWVWFGFGFGLA
jgi:hypothetical protein